MVREGVRFRIVFEVFCVGLERREMVLKGVERRKGLVGRKRRFILRVWRRFAACACFWCVSWVYGGGREVSKRSALSRGSPGLSALSSVSRSRSLVVQSGHELIDAAAITGWVGNGVATRLIPRL